MQSIVNITIRPFLWLGRNPLFVFVFMDLLAIIMIKYIIIDDKSIWAWFYKYCFREWIDNDNVASVVFACFFLALWMAAAALLYWKKIFIRLWFLVFYFFNLYNIIISFKFNPLFMYKITRSYLLYIRISQRIKKPKKKH